MITSMTNQKVKRIVQLNKKAALRNKEDVFVAEGVKMFLEAPKEDLVEIYVSENFVPFLPEENPDCMGHTCSEEQKGREGAIGKKLESCGYERVAKEVFGKMSDTQSPQGILCVVRQRHYSLEDILGRKTNPLLIVLENLQDPGNLGTVFRSGEAAGVCGVVMSKDTADVYNPKVIRATMGSAYRMPFYYAEDLTEAIEKMKRAGVEIFAAHLKGEKSYEKCDYRKASAFLIGNEGNGLTEQTAAFADTYVKIPMEGEVESLNASVAAAVLTFEAARQRRT